MKLLELALILSLPALYEALVWIAAAKLDKLPDRTFSQATNAQKIGRLAICATALVAFLGPVLWFVFK